MAKKAPTVTLICEKNRNRNGDGCAYRKKCPRTICVANKDRIPSRAVIRTRFFGASAPAAAVDAAVDPRLVPTLPPRAADMILVEVETGGSWWFPLTVTMLLVCFLNDGVGEMFANADDSDETTVKERTIIAKTRRVGEWYILLVLDTAFVVVLLLLRFRLMDEGGGKARRGTGQRKEEIDTQ